MARSALPGDSDAALVSVWRGDDWVQFSIHGTHYCGNIIPSVEPRVGHPDSSASLTFILVSFGSF